MYLLYYNKDGREIFKMKTDSDENRKKLCIRSVFSQIKFPSDLIEALKRNFYVSVTSLDNIEIKPRVFQLNANDTGKKFVECYYDELNGWGFFFLFYGFLM